MKILLSKALKFFNIDLKNSVKNCSGIQKQGIYSQGIFTSKLTK